MTNATKAGIITLINAGLGLAIAFDIALTQGQVGAIMAVANAALALWVGLTKQNSPKRIPDA